MIVAKHDNLPQQLAPKIELVVSSFRSRFFLFHPLTLLLLQGMDFLLPLFFANSGIRTNITQLDQGKYWFVIGIDSCVLPCIHSFARSFIRLSLQGLHHCHYSDCDVWQDVSLVRGRQALCAQKKHTASPSPSPRSRTRVDWSSSVPSISACNWFVVFYSSFSIVPFVSRFRFRKSSARVSSRCSC